MPAADDGLGKEAESKIKEWLDKPEKNYSFDRFYDQMTGYYKVSRNICDFVVYKYPYQYYIESKATWEDRFDFSMISKTQSEGLQEKSKIAGCYGLVMVLFASYQRAFIFNIEDIAELQNQNVKSLNIKKIKKWVIPYVEVLTIPNNRKKHLDYTGYLNDYIDKLDNQRLPRL